MFSGRVRSAATGVSGSAHVPRAGLRPTRPPWGSRRLGAALRLLENPPRQRGRLLAVLGTARDAYAAADIDGDGRVALYFVNQLGPSQLWRNLAHPMAELQRGA